MGGRLRASVSPEVLPQQECRIKATKKGAKAEEKKWNSSVVWDLICLPPTVLFSEKGSRVGAEEDANKSRSGAVWPDLIPPFCRFYLSLMLANRE